LSKFKTKSDDLKRFIQKENNLLAVVPVLLDPSKSAPELGETRHRESARSGLEVGEGLLEDCWAPREVWVLRASRRARAACADPRPCRPRPSSAISPGAGRDRGSGKTSSSTICKWDEARSRSCGCIYPFAESFSVSDCLRARFFFLRNSIR
jgi:hypothetical protein